MIQADMRADCLTVEENVNAVIFLVIYARGLFLYFFF